jgi:putative oxidoreductase
MSSVIERWSALAPELRSALRIVAGLMFLMAGTTKLFAWPIGMPPNGGTAAFGTQIWIGGLLELVCGGLLTVGLLTRPAAFLMAGQMAVAYFQFHFTQGFWPTQNGGVTAVLYCFVWLYFSAVGPGPWSVDALRRKS